MVIRDCPRPIKNSFYDQISNIFIFQNKIKMVNSCTSEVLIFNDKRCHKNGYVSSEKKKHVLIRIMQTKWVTLDDNH